VSIDPIGSNPAVRSIVLQVLHLIKLPFWKLSPQIV
jgi:hypothetical protein